MGPTCITYMVDEARRAKGILGRRLVRKTVCNCEPTAGSPAFIITHQCTRPPSSSSIGSPPGCLIFSLHLLRTTDFALVACLLLALCEVDWNYSQWLKTRLRPPRLVSVNCPSSTPHSVVRKSSAFCGFPACFVGVINWMRTEPL
jgi:hypothetical protein